MRLKGYYINESLNEKMSDINEYALKSYLTKNCKKFIREFGKIYANGEGIEPYFIHRGIRNPVNNFFEIKKPRTDRKPRLVSSKSHQFLTKIGKEVFGWDIRQSGVFTAARPVTANYGYASLFFPAGNYKYVFIPDTHDIYAAYDKLDFAFDADENWQRDRQHSFWENDPKGLARGDQESADDIHQWKTEIRYIYETQYKSTGLAEAIKRRDLYEAIFNCKEYILMHSETENIERLIKVMKQIVY